MPRLLLVFFACFVSMDAQDSRPTSRPAVATVDAYGRFVVRGAPVFVNGWYSDGSFERLKWIAEGPFNAVLDYGLTARPVEETRRYLAEAERLGVMVIACLNDVYPSATYRTSLGAWRGNDAILEGVIGVVKGSPAVVAYYDNDELPIDKKTEIQGYARRIRELDPTRPLLMVHETPASFGAFLGSADVFGIDHYPIPQHGPAAFGEVFDATRAAVGSSRPLWAVLQNFAWYQHRDPRPPLVRGDLETERARLPHPDEWRESRPPTFDEMRAMNYVALVHGAQSLLWWCLYNLDFLPDREERRADARRVGAEVKELTPFLLSPDGARVAWSDARIQAVEKRIGGKRVSIAVNVANEPVRAEVVVDPKAAVPSREVEVRFESRRARVVDGKLVDFFAPYARHVYVVNQ